MRSRHSRASGRRESGFGPAVRRATPWIVLLCLLNFGGVAVAGRIQLFQPRHGNAFFPDETVEMTLILLLDDPFSSPEPRLEYRVEDFWSETILTGRLTIERTSRTSGRVHFSPPLPPEARGWFRATFQLIDGASRLELQNAEMPTREPYITFAVVERPRDAQAFSSVVGVAEHQLDRAHGEVMQRAGVRRMRVDALWHTVQSEREGRFDWSRLDGIFDVADEFGIGILPIVNYTAPFAAQPIPGLDDPKRLAVHPPFEDDWRRFVRALVDRYKDRVKVWEIWNEANLRYFWPGTPEQYVDLLRQAYEEIRAADPGARVAVAGTSKVDLEWLKQIAAIGAGPYMDIVAVHPYRQPASPEERLAEDLARVRAWIEKELPSPRGVSERQLWITEIGYHTRGDHGPVSEQDAARYLVRTVVTALASGVPKIYWYEFADGGVDQAYSERNFGLTYHNLTPKPAYVAYSVMERLIGGATAARRLTSNDEAYHAYLLSSEAGDVIVAWTVAGEHSVFVSADGPITVIDLMGRTMPMSETIPDKCHGARTLTLTPSPIYVLGRNVSIGSLRRGRIE